MSLTVIWYNEALDFLRKLDEDISERIAKKVDSIILNPKRYLFSLTNIDSYKLRVGNYRVFIDYSENENKLIIRSIKHRKNAYKN